jgi:hypothetical protein
MVSKRRSYQISVSRIVFFWLKIVALVDCSVGGGGRDSKDGEVINKLGYCYLLKKNGVPWICSVIPIARIYLPPS